MTVMSSLMLWKPKRSSWIRWHCMRGECQQVVLCNSVNLNKIVNRFMYMYDDVTMEQIPLQLGPGEKLHIVVPQDKCIAHVNEHQHTVWLLNRQQPMCKKGNDCTIMISNWIIKTPHLTTGHLHLSVGSDTGNLQVYFFVPVPIPVNNVPAWVGVQCYCGFWGVTHGYSQVLTLICILII
jgi:hypothetical protein